MARHLLDSDVLIWVLRGKPAAVEFVRGLQRDEVPAISALAFYEVWAGARPSEDETVSRFLSAFSMIPVDSGIATTAARYYREFRGKGVTLSAVDALVAATARVHGLILVTQNRRGFPMTDIEKKSL